MLAGYSWPGNIRELKNVIERIVLTAGSSKMDPALINQIAGVICENMDKTASDCGRMTDIKFNAVMDVFKEENYNKSRAAKAAWNRQVNS
jgi:transcriptional regulator with PAS, ATPase and Fis domain